jgi:hypothetical protein
MLCKPKLNAMTSHRTGRMSCVINQRSKQATPIAVSFAPPSETSHGPCCTCAVEARSFGTLFVASVVYPIDTLSPIIKTFLSVVEGGSPGPGLQHTVVFFLPSAGRPSPHPCDLLHSVFPMSTVHPIFVGEYWEAQQSSSFGHAVGKLALHCAGAARSFRLTLMRRRLPSPDHPPGTRARSPRQFAFALGPLLAMIFAAPSGHGLPVGTLTTFVQLQFSPCLVGSPEARANKPSTWLSCAGQPWID